MCAILVHLVGSITLFLMKKLTKRQIYDASADRYIYIYIIFLARIKRLKRKYIHNVCIKTFPAHFIGNLFLELEEIVSSRLIYFFIFSILYILLR